MTDKDDNLTPLIAADSHSEDFAKRYGRASELVGNRHSKAALVSLVAYLLREPRMKSLVWEEPSARNYWLYTTETLFGVYGIHINGGRHRAWFELPDTQDELWLGEADVGSVYEAQQAAQADYDRRVRELLK